MEKKKNIILILVDQLRSDVLSCYGGEICKTPNIDRLAAESVLFERAYTPTAVCTPARASLMTGQFPHNHGVVSNGEGPIFKGTLHDESNLLSRRLEALGYDLRYNGKWHLGAEDPQHLPKNFGFSGLQMPGHGDGGYHFPEFKKHLQKKDLKIDFFDGPHELGWNRYGTLNGSEETEVSTFLANDAISYLNTRSTEDENPFFLWVNFWGPHEPYYPTKEYLDLYNGIDIPPWPNFNDSGENKPKVHQTKIPPEAKELGWKFWEPAVRHYFAFISLIDNQIGRILSKIEEQGLEEDTVVIFAADHGESIGAHGCQDKGHFMYEETYRIPLMIRAPFARPRKDESLVSLVDFCSTILDIAGEEHPNSGRDGMSLMGHLLGDVSDWRNMLVAEFHGLVTPFTQRMIVSERYKYVWNLGDTDEVYDLYEDPYELKNLIYNDNVIEHRDTLQIELLEWMKDTNDTALNYYQRYLLNK